MGMIQIRGAILEGLVLHLLEMVGYRSIAPGQDGTVPGAAGLEVVGRGETHQIDALVALDKSPPFMYPIHLLVEAKCKGPRSKVPIDIIRNAVGVLKDISENYISHHFAEVGGDVIIEAPRYIYQSAVISTSGFTSDAQRYAIAHQIYLIQYKDVPLFIPVINGLLGLRDLHFVNDLPRQHTLLIRDEIASALAVLAAQVETELGQGIIDDQDEFDWENPEEWWDEESSLFTEGGAAYLQSSILRPILSIKGSYYGALQGRWPIHLLSQTSLPEEPFQGTDEVRCRILRRHGVWGFESLENNRHADGHFRLEFSLPNEIERLIAQVDGDRIEVANLKEREFSYVNVIGKIGGVQRNVRLSLDPHWIDMMRNREMRRRRRR